MPDAVSSEGAEAEVAENAEKRPVWNWLHLASVSWPGTQSTLLGARGGPTSARLRRSGRRPE